MNDQAPRLRISPIVLLAAILVAGPLVPGATSQDAPVAWIHLSESPPPYDTEQVCVDQYFGDGPELYACLFVDHTPGGYVTGIECRHWFTVDNGSVVVEEFTPFGQWSHDSSPPGEFRDWPRLPGDQTPALLGYWRLRLLRGRESRGQIGLATDPRGGIPEPLVLTGTGRAAPLATLSGAGINTAAPASCDSPIFQAMAELSWFPRRTKDIPRLDGVQPVKTLCLRVPYPGLMRKGHLGTSIWTERGTLQHPELIYGRPDELQHPRRGWVTRPLSLDLGMDGTFLAFQGPDHTSIRELVVAIPLRLRPEDPLAVEVPWVIFEAPSGLRDTLWTQPPQNAVTVLGGVSQRVPVAICWEPSRGRVRDPLAIHLLGSGLDLVHELSLLGDYGQYSAAHLEVRRAGAQLQAFFPNAPDRPGRYRIQLRAECGADISTISGVLLLPHEGEGGDREDPWWVVEAEAVDKDYILVVPDRFYYAADDLASTIRYRRALYPVCLTLSEIRAAFPGEIPDSADALSIQQALRFAYENWKTAPLFALLVGDASAIEPSFDLLPTHYEEAIDPPHGWNDATCPVDSWFGDIVEGSDAQREIVVGRLPARSSEDIRRYEAKLIDYATTHEPSGRVGFIVGDANTIAQDVNHACRAASVRIKQHIKTLAPLDTVSLYALDLIGDEPDWTEEHMITARDAAIDLIDSGLDIVEFFGNTQPTSGHLPVTMFLRYDSPASSYYDDYLNAQFQAALLDNVHHLPLCIFDHCDVGSFDEYSTLPCSPAEDFVLGTAATHGAVAAVGKAEMAYFDASESISRLLWEELLEHSGGRSCLGFQVNGAVERYLQSPECRRQEYAFEARKVNVIGDPSVRIKIDPTPRRLDGTFEARGAIPTQRRGAPQGYGYWTSANLIASESRIVHAGRGETCCDAVVADENVSPVEGQRMFRACARHANDGQPMKAVRTMFEAWETSYAPLVRLTVPPGSRGIPLLSYWIRQDVSPSRSGCAFVDLIAGEAGGLSEYSTDAVYDQYGRPFTAAEQDYPLEIWQHIWVRLAPWAIPGYPVHKAVVRYEVADGPDEQSLVYVDAVFAGIWNDGVVDVPGNVVLNGTFSVDQNRDGYPDFWTGPYGVIPSLPGARVLGTGSAVLLDSALESPALMSQLLSHRQECTTGCFDVSLRAKSFGSPTGDNSIAIRIRQAETGDLTFQREFSLAAEWEDIWVMGIGEPAVPCFLEIAAPAGPVVVDDVSAVCTDCATRVPRDLPRRDGFAVRVRPCPTAGRVALLFHPDEDRTWQARLFSLDGRCVREWQIDAPGSRPETALDLRPTQSPLLTSGIYYLRLTSGSCRRQFTLPLISNKR